MSKGKRMKGKHYAETKEIKQNVPSKEPNLIANKTRMIAVVLIIICFVVDVGGLLAFLSDYTAVVNVFTTKTLYELAFDANGGTGTASNQQISYNVPTAIQNVNFTKSGYQLAGWNTQADGSGTAFTPNQQVTQNDFVSVATPVTLYAQWELLNPNAVAEYNGTYYTSLQDAVNDVDDDDVPVTVRLLQDTAELIEVAVGQNIIFDFGNHTLSSTNNLNVIRNNGTITITNGTIYTNATQGAINNNPGGKLYMTGGSIIATRDRQAIYNDSGYVEISGTAYLESACTGNRGTVQNNTATSEMVIKGGTIISKNTSGVYNVGILTIGDKDGTASKTDPEIRGGTNGVTTTTNINFYDGILKGKSNAISDETKIVDIENNVHLEHALENIGGQSYKTLYQTDAYVVIFDPNGGTVSEMSREVVNGQPIGALPDRKSVV